MAASLSKIDDFLAVSILQLVFPLVPLCLEQLHLGAINPLTILLLTALQTFNLGIQSSSTTIKIVGALASIVLFYLYGATLTMKTAGEYYNLSLAVIVTASILYFLERLITFFTKVVNIWSI